MNINPRQNDPQFHSPTQGDSERASQFGMGSQADVPVQGANSAPAQPVVPNPALVIGPSSIVPGAEVYGSDGQKVGAVEEVYDDSFLVQKGIFFVRDFYIPLQYVAGVSNDRVDLSLTSEQARSQKWTNRPGRPAHDAGPGPQASTEYGVYGPQGQGDTIQAATERGETE